MSGNTARAITKESLLAARDLALGCIRSISPAAVNITSACRLASRCEQQQEDRYDALGQAAATAEETFGKLNDMCRQLRAALYPDVVTLIEIANADDHGLVTVGRTAVATYHQAAEVAAEQFVTTCLLPAPNSCVLPAWVDEKILGIIPQAAMPTQHAQSYAYYNCLVDQIRSHRLPEVELIEAGIRREYALTAARLQHDKGALPNGPDPLDDEEIKILRALLGHRGRYLTNTEIEQNYGPSRKIVGQKLPHLIGLGFVVRHQNERKGVAITDGGAAAIEPFLPKKASR